MIEKPSREKKPGLTYKEKKELEQLEKDLESLENEKAAIEASFSDSSLPHDKVMRNSERLGVVLKEIETKTDRWIELSELAI